MVVRRGSVTFERERKRRTKVEEEGLRHRQGRRRRLESGFQDLDALLQLALAQKRHSQIINGLEERKKEKGSAPGQWSPIAAQSPPARQGWMTTTTTTTHSIVRVVLLDEAAQERAGRVPVPARGREKGGVERFGRLGRVRVRRDGRKMRLGLVELSRLEVHAAERGAQLAVRLRRRRLVLLCGERLQQRRGGRKVLQSVPFDLIRSGSGDGMAGSPRGYSKLLLKTVCRAVP